MSGYLHLKDLDLHGKRVLVRVDCNVPIQSDKIMDDARIRAIIPTIQQIIENGGVVNLLSHLGRPIAGSVNQHFSLEPVAQHLEGLLDREVAFVSDWLNTTHEHTDAQITFCENVRFLQGETECDEELSRKMASLCDIYVNDAFAMIHRQHASNHGIAKYAPVACIGPLMIKELKAINTGLLEIKRPFVAIVGGSKISTKLPLLQVFARHADVMILGGGIANTFLQIQGFSVGRSLVEARSTAMVNEIMHLARDSGCRIVLPKDVLCAERIVTDAASQIRTLETVKQQELILDYGPESIQSVTEVIQQAATIIWNGPLGVFEIPAFSQGTRMLGEAIAASKAYSIVGGGDTVAAVNMFELADKLAYVSTGGSAFLKLVENILDKKDLPVLSILYESARAWRAMERGREM